MFMVSCKELKERAPTCFQRFGAVNVGEIVLPNYAKAYECLWELSVALNIPVRDIWIDGHLIENVIQCYKKSL